MNYKVLIESNHSSYELEIETNDIEWSMDQYQRNRPPFSYKVIEIDGVIQT